jgi:hypothetical protein
MITDIEDKSRMHFMQRDQIDFSDNKFPKNNKTFSKITIKLRQNGFNCFKQKQP